jgi:uncharacterized protein (DUF1499 family)
MKRGWRSMGLVIAFGVVALLGLMALVRLAPTEAQHWHEATGPYVWTQAAPWDQVVAQTGGAVARLSQARGAPRDVLARLDAIAAATPRTQRIAGSVDEGRITWQTRSALWGFPDFTTAEVRDNGVYLYARLRFGSEDMGVNAKRLKAWIAAL